VLKACDGIGHGAYHFSSGKDVAIQELYDAVVNALNVPGKPQAEVKDLGPDDVFSILLDPSRTFADYGAIEFTPLQETVSAAMAYYQQHGTLGEYTHLRQERK
jgi:nucleoside-diphosphate-sugar epimerase